MKDNIFLEISLYPSTKYKIGVLIYMYSITILPSVHLECTDTLRGKNANWTLCY